MKHASTNFVTWRVVGTGTAVFTVTYDGKTATIKLEGLNIPDDAETAWEDFYRERMGDLLDVVRGKKTIWREHPDV